MPILLTPEKEVAFKTPQARARVDMTKGVELELTPEQKSVVVLTKYVSNDPLRADFQPSNEWFEQVTSDVGGKRRTSRLQVVGVNGENKGLSIDDGLIVDLVGTLAGMVGILPNRPPLSLEEVEEYVDATDESVPLFQQWNFRVVKVVKTNGPELRLALNRSEDQKRVVAQTEMFDTFRQMLEQGVAALRSAGNLSPTAQQILEAGTKK